MKRIVCLILALVMASFALVSCSNSVPYKVTDEQTDLVIIDVKKYGKIVVKLEPDQAPETVANFKKLVSEGFYDGLIFHRVIKDFMIQGGGFDASNNNKESASIKGEFLVNGFEGNNIKHERGVISMARTNDPNSASSQFFIMHQDFNSLDGNYAAFGRTVYGIEVVDKIASAKTMTLNMYFEDYPMEPITIKSIKFAVEK